MTQDTCERVLADGMVPNGINPDFPRSNSNNDTEDGWVEVEAPDSLRPDNTSSISNISVENISPKTQVTMLACLNYFCFLYPFLF